MIKSIAKCDDAPTHYHTRPVRIGDIVKVSWGRNKGMWGEVTAVHNESITVDWGGAVVGLDGTTWGDYYYVRESDIVEIKEK